MMVTIKIEGIGNASVRGAARRFAKFCSEEGMEASKPEITKSGLEINDHKGALPAIIGKKVETYIAEVNVVTDDTGKINGYEFPNTVNTKIIKKESAQEQSKEPLLIPQVSSLA